MKKRFLLPLLAAPLFLFGVASCSETEQNSEILTKVVFTYDASNLYAYVDGVKSGYEDVYTDLVIPDTVIKDGTSYTVVGVNSKAFSSNSDLKSIVLPDTVTTIEQEAFARCTGLRYIDMGNGVTSAGTFTFDKCTALVNVTIPSSLKSLSKGMFRNCTNLVGINLPNGVTSIPYQAFMGDTALDYISANKITTIEESAFESCSNLDYIFYQSEEYTEDSIGDSNTYYSNATKTYSVDLSTNDTLDEFYFVFNPSNDTCDISGLKDYSQTTIDSIPESVTWAGHNYTIDGIYKYAFYNADLTSITLNDSIIYIGNYAFSGSNLESFNSNKVVTISQYAFKDCESLTSLTLGDSVASILTYAFQNCIALVSVVLPLNITDITKGMFSGCTALQKVTIQENVTSIKADVFADCTALKTINYTGSSDDWANITIDSSFTDDTADATIVYNYEI